MMRGEGQHRPLAGVVVREVIEARVIEGMGVEGDPVRSVVYYHDPASGRQLARYDEWEEGQRGVGEAEGTTEAEGQA